MNTVRTQGLSNELNNLLVELVTIELSSFTNVTMNMLSNEIKFYSELTPFNTVSINYLSTLCHNKGLKANA